VALPQALNYEAPASITSEIGESWRILARRVSGGVVLLGIAQTNRLQDADSVLLANAKEFGSSLEDAMKVRPRNVDRNVDYCVVDGYESLRFAVGGIPIRAMPPPTNTADSITELSAGGRSYKVLFSPLFDAATNVVGALAIPRDDTFERQTLRNSVWFNVVLAAVSWLVLGLLSANYFLKDDKARRAYQLSVGEALSLEESDILEVKSSLRWDYIQRKVNRDLEEVIVKTVVAFLNTSGGVLLIGVADDRTILGLQPDYESLPKKSRDGFQLHLQQILSQRVGVDRYQSRTSLEFHEVQGKDVCIVRVRPAVNPVILKDQNLAVLYVRAGAATRALNVEEAIRYVQEHWGGYA